MGEKSTEDLSEWSLYKVITRGVVGYSLLAMLVAAGVTTFFLWLKPLWLSLEREADVNSHQYVEARKTEVLTNIQKYDELSTRITQNQSNTKVVEALRMQQRSLKMKIKNALVKIPRESRPEGTRRFQ